MSANATTVSRAGGLLGSHLNVELDQAEGGFRLVYGERDVSVVLLWGPMQRCGAIGGATDWWALAAKSVRRAVFSPVWTKHGQPASSWAFGSWGAWTRLASWRAACIELKGNRLGRGTATLGTATKVNPGQLLVEGDEGWRGVGGTCTIFNGWTRSRAGRMLQRE